MNTPQDLRYTAEHEWVRATEGATVRVGITDYAQSALGDIVFVSLPSVGTAVTPGQPLGEVESTKSVSDVYAPVSGTVVARNEHCGRFYATLGDTYLAEDAAQEAFISAWRNLDQLRVPDAFPGWFKRIVLTQCSRLTRNKQFELVPLEAMAELSTQVAGPPELRSVTGPDRGWPCRPSFQRM